MHSEPCATLQSKYYSEKLGIHKHDAAGRRRVAACFIEGLHWVLEYYYRGVASWTWFFPYHFAPMISDMTDIQEFDVAFQLGQPFLPFQQLLGVLPSASFKLLPEPFQVGLICPLTEACAFQFAAHAARVLPGFLQRLPPCPLLKAALPAFQQTTVNPLKLSSS